MKTPNSLSQKKFIKYMCSSQNQQTHVGLDVYLVKCSLRFPSRFVMSNIVSSMVSGKKSWKVNLMSSTLDIAYRVGPGIILTMFSTLALPPLSWEEECQSSVWFEICKSSYKADLNRYDTLLGLESPWLPSGHISTRKRQFPWMKPNFHFEMCFTWGNIGVCMWEAGCGCAGVHGDIFHVMNEHNLVLLINFLCHSIWPGIPQVLRSWLDNSKYNESDDWHLV